MTQLGVPRALRLAALSLMVMAMSAASTGSALAFDPAVEAQNVLKTQERAAYDYGRPDYQTRLRADSLEGRAEGLSIIAQDGPTQPFGRDFLGNLCWSHEDGCAGDVRFWHWANNADFVRKPVLFTARNGSTLSGHVWHTISGPSKRPGVVITNGSIQAPEELYGFAAATLARAGYVVLTWDPQGQGRSDTFGEGGDRDDGVPSQGGQPFYDGTEDALDFFFSTPSRRYEPRRSCSSGTSHADKQAYRVAMGLNPAYNPAWHLLDTSRVGLAGHSLGARAVSYVGQLDARVKAIVAWDNLSTPTTSFTCPGGSSPRPPTVPITRPALGMSADYGLVVTPNTSDPNPDAKSGASLAYTEAGVDTGELVIRGGTHYEFSFIPNVGFPATLRGMDLVAWYTRAWMDRYVKGDKKAESALLTDRWRDDARGAAVDETGDSNLFSFYYRSRLNLGKVACEDIRSGCPVLAPDGKGPYSYLAAAGLPDELDNAGR
jgi:dienelactone hydrolase